MTPIRFLAPALAAAAALALPGAALAAPHWSAPAQVVAPPADPQTQFVAAPEARFGPGDALLAFAGDGTRPLVLRGTVAGGFGAPTAVGTSAAGAVRGAVGADGTLAAYWVTGDHPQVAIAPAGGTFGAPADLPGPGANAGDVAVAADGSVVVAYRTKAKDGTYAIEVAGAPPGGALGAPTIIDSGKGGISTVDVATGPSGSVAVVWARQISGQYRTRAAFSPAGTTAFTAAQSLSSDATAPDLEPQVAFDADGTAVVAWANPGGAEAAFRHPADSAFGAAVSLGQPGFGLDLEPTPQGGTAVALSGPSSILAAIQSGDGFALQPVAAYSGNIPPEPAIAVDAAGTATVLYGDPTSGAVNAVVPGAATTTIGYGRPGMLTAVTLAAGAAGHAVALWHDSQDGISTSIFGPDAPAAPSGPITPPAKPVTTPPKLTLVSSLKLRVTRRTTSLTLKLRCNMACSTGADGILHTTVRGHKRIAPLHPVEAQKRAARKGTQTLTIRLGTRGTADLRRALKAHRGALASLRLTAVDAAGNQKELRVQLTLRAR